MKRLLAVLLCLVLVGSVTTPINVQAQTCSTLFDNINEVRRNLRSAANETNLESARDYVTAARNALVTTTMATMDCNWNMANMQFNSALSYIRRAHDANTSEEFVDYLNKAIQAFNRGVNAVNLKE